MIKVTSDAGYIFRRLVAAPAGTKVFHPTWGDGLHLESFDVADMNITAIANSRQAVAQRFPDADFSRFDEHIYRSHRHCISINTNPELYRIEKQFHFCFNFSNYSLTRDAAGKIRIVSKEVEDAMLYFECSKSDISQERKAQEHLINMEQMFHATLIGGYFAAVVPKRWTGTKAKYAKWFNDTAATVARITLPHSAITYSQDELDKVGLTLEQVQADPNLRWELVVWCKPMPDRQSRAHSLLFAEMRWPVFIYHTLQDTDIKETARLMKIFSKHEWYKRSVKLWNEMLVMSQSSMEYGTNDSAPVELPDPSSIHIFRPTTVTRPQFKIADNLVQIENDPYGIHIKPGPPLRVRAYNPVAIAMWHDMEAISDPVNIPATNSKPAQVLWTESYGLRRKNFGNNREELIRNIQQKGMTPYILRTDISRLSKQVKWMATQLAPIERCIKTKIVDPDTKGPPTVVWNWMYDDAGIRASNPQLWKMWEKRLRKMKLDKLEFDYQFIDQITMCCKSSLINSNVMGLGKTLQLLLLQLARGIKYGLYVVPSHLLGVWQDEIEGNITRYVRSICRKNWMGKPMKTDYQIIEWGEQCLPGKLATFNLISYEKLGSIPRDTLFFKCPKCGFIAGSVRRHERQPCPSKTCENYGRNKRLKEINRLRGLRKYKFQAADGYVQTVDDRINPPLLMMEKLDYKQKKMSLQFNGYTEASFPTGVPGTEDIVGMLPTYTSSEKCWHLKWTFSELLRNQFNYVAVDEAVKVKNPDTLRTNALYHLTPRHRVPATGTPIRGYPQSVLSMVNWCLKRSVFPDYRAEDKGAEARFLAKYGTKVENLQTGKSKLIAKANNPEQLQAELAPFLLRHLREEPAVEKNIPKKQSIPYYIPLRMDDEHRAYYQKWLDHFVEWFIEMKKEEGKNPRGGEIIVKMGYLRNASTTPHAMFDAMTQRRKKKGAKDTDIDGAAWAAVIGPYKGPPTQKQLWTQQLLTKIKTGGTLELPNFSADVVDTDQYEDLFSSKPGTLELPGKEKAIVFSLRRASLDAMQLWAKSQKDPPIYSMIVDGRISNAIQKGSNKSRKHEMIDDFRTHEYDALMAGLQALSEGHNIPEANHGIMMDYSWEPSDHRQGIGRMLRMQQPKIVREYYLTHLGTIDDYMGMLCVLKGRSMDEVVDHMEFDDFGVKMIPDINQYAESIVDGTEKVKRAEMYLAVEDILRREREGSEDED